MSKVVGRLVTKVIYLWNSGRKGKITIAVPVLVFLMGLITCCNSSSDNALRSAQSYEEEARAKFEELIAEDYEAGLQTINAAYAEMTAELWKHNLKIHELIPTGVILLDRGSDVLIEIKENTAGELVYPSALITEGDAINLWNMIMPIAKLKAISDMDALRKLSQKHDEKMRQEVEKQKQQQAQRMEDLKKFDEIRADYKRFYAAYNDPKLREKYADDLKQLGLDSTSDDNAWKEVMNKIKQKSRAVLGVYEPDDDNSLEWKTARDNLERYGWQNRKPFKLFDKESLVDPYQNK